MELYYQPDLALGINNLSEEESRHCVKVLRRKVGDRIVIVDGKGLKVQAEITEANPKKCQFRILDKEQQAPPVHKIHIAVAPTKNQDRTEWFLEKAVEIGIQTIDFYFGTHSERKKLNLDRLEKKAVSAMKQSGQAFLPEINIYKNLSALLNSRTGIQDKFIAYVDFSNTSHLADLATKNQSAIVLIGPEGDFSEDELQLALDNGYRKVSLGGNRLRTETAALAACHILNLVNR